MSIFRQIKFDNFIYEDGQLCIDQEQTKPNKDIPIYNSLH